ncbi:uncharacterized protein LOC117320832 [Pecten maximus]|uniref:uncharacterized protein LOC117320832 n=1 Tax=Pecten maximus TaxID=6579 RepID=UPI001458B398|nr:uncharacterized protein LOC117320832 [Pecten maximus]XP_033731208.1 uncharacterized protein LOC117320832 [Pecten maximus]
MASWEGDFYAMQFAIVEDKEGYAEIKIEKKELGDLKKLDFNVTFDDSTRELRVRTRKDGELHGFNYQVKGPIKTTSLSGGFKKEKSKVILRIEKKEKFNF